MTVRSAASVRRALLTAGLAVFGGASLVCALAPSLPVLVAARVVQGAGGALAVPVGLALLTTAYPPALRGRALGWALGVGGVATACGPFAGGLGVRRDQDGHHGRGGPRCGPVRPRRRDVA
jgi:MFS family permease